MRFKTVTMTRQFTGPSGTNIEEVMVPAHKGLAYFSNTRGRWHIYHVNSGLILGWRGSKAKARNLIAELLETFPDMDWSQGERAVYDACADLGITVWLAKHWYPSSVQKLSEK